MDTEDLKLVLSDIELEEFNAHRRATGFSGGASFLRDKMGLENETITVTGYGLYEFKDLPGAAITVLYNY